MTQQELVRRAKKKLGLTTKNFAGFLKVSESTVNSWLLPETSKAHRKMPVFMRDYIELKIK